MSGMRLVVGILVLTACPKSEPEPQACESILAEFDAELASVQSCEEPDACGQPISGTSCGCTRDLVARVDADITQVVELLRDGAEMECDLGVTSVCDCPEALGFDCLEGTCVFNLVERYPYLPACPQAGESITVEGVALVGDILVVDVAYGGGCHVHQVALCWNDQAFQPTDPPTAALSLFHDGDLDPCDAWIMETKEWRVAPLKEAYAETYSPSGTMVLTLDGHALDYTFEAP